MEHIVIPITAHTLTLTLLTYVIDRADRGDFDDFIGFISPEELDQMRGMPVRDLMAITSQGRPIVSLRINTRQLRHSIKHLNVRIEDESVQVWFIRRGAPHFLMVELFGTTEREFRDLRRQAGVTERGRPVVLKHRVAAEVREEWGAIPTSLSLIDRYRQLGELFPDITLASLYAAINDKGE